MKNLTYIKTTFEWEGWIEISSSCKTIFICSFWQLIFSFNICVDSENEKDTFIKTMVQLKEPMLKRLMIKDEKVCWNKWISQNFFNDNQKM